MAKFSKAQYELLTEAFGEALADVAERDSPLLDTTAMGVARKVASSLKYDNPNFNIKQFISGIESVVALDKLSKKGIH
ncbi:MAG: hypothetical protein ACOH18_05510 [Candidatus Saccharimonadaceae bacterium]